MLVFIGLGLEGDEGISLKGLRETQEANGIYAEFYTSKIPKLEVKELEKKIGKPIKVVDREIVEERPNEILETARNGKAAFLVPGDPMVATTHVDLRLRAEEAGIKTRIVHGASIETAAPGIAGLQSYKFGRSATIPLPEKPSRTPYETLAQNLEHGLHTLLLLDINVSEERYLDANDAIEIMLELESEIGKGIFTSKTLVVVVARAGSTDAVVKAGSTSELSSYDFGDPPHVLIVPGKLHFLEAKALRTLGEARKELVNEYVK